MKHADPDIHAINLHRGIVVLDCGAIVPITNMFDVMNEETHDLEDACTIVAGPHDGKWFSAAVSSFDGEVN